MATTMSMFRSGIFLMASFMGVSGLFILLSADLLGLLQVMMYIGGMLVMVLFMALFSHDPGGDMMAGMEFPWVERTFSRGLLPRGSGGAREVRVAARADAGTPAQGDGVDAPAGDGPERDAPARRERAGEGHEGHGHEGHEHEGHGHEGHGHEGHEHEGMDMSMVTPVRPWAAALGVATSALLIVLLLWRPSWALDPTGAVQPLSARHIGDLLMGKYMMAFEGAGLLILTGIFGAVYVGRPDRHPSPEDRRAFVGRDVPPPPLDDDTLTPRERSGGGPT